MTEAASLLEIADELYALGLPDFTPARDAKAKELKGTDLAGPVKALKKPTLGAWVVNLFVRRDADQVDQVLSMGAALREAQAGMSGDELRALTRQRRQLTSAVTQQARSLASEAGVRVTSSVADQVEATLTAAMISEACGQAVRSGLLVTTLTTTGLDEVDVAAALAVPEALGFTAIARTVEEPERPDLRVVPDPDAGEKALAAARERLGEAQEVVDQARAAHDEAAQQVDQFRARQLQVEAEIDELKRRIAELESTRDDVDDDLADAEEARSDAETALTEASTDRDAAVAVVDSLG